MSSWLDPIRATLAEAAAPIRWFFRDDDGGWDDARLLALVDTFRDAGGHVDLAAIPAATSPALGRRLVRLGEEGTLSVHQHGWSHADHELRGRKCEFGPSRSTDEQRLDLARGGRVLAERLEGRTEPFFTPPWNRCTDSTAGLLADLGFTVLSADRSAPRRGVDGLAEIPVTVDWTRAWSRGGPPALAEALHGAAAGGEPVGVMLHHAVMSRVELVALGELLAFVRDSPQVLATSIVGLLDERTLTPASPTGHEATAR